MARKKICITLTRPQPCRFDGKQLILQNELNLEPVKVLSDCLANFVSELESAAGGEVEKCSTTTLDLDEDHYYVCVVIDVEESKKFGEMEIQRFLTYLFDDGQASFFDSTTVSVNPAAFFRRAFRSGEFLPSSIEHGRPGNGQGGNGALASA
jgi:hypothetical protein